MNNYFDKQLFFYFKKNLISFFSLIFLLVIFIYLIFQVIIKNSELIEKNRITNEQNILLKNKLNRLNSLASYNLDKKIKLINKIIPKNDDVFTVATTLLKLSNKLNIILPSFEVNANQIKKNKFSVKVDILTSDILDFLSKYLLTTGRLITISSIKINTESNKYTVDLNFYNLDPKQTKQANIKEVNFENIYKIEEVANEFESTIEFDNVNPTSFPKTEFNFEKIQLNDDPFLPI